MKKIMKIKKVKVEVIEKVMMIMKKVKMIMKEIIIMTTNRDKNFRKLMNNQVKLLNIMKLIIYKDNKAEINFGLIMQILN